MAHCRQFSAAFGRSGSTCISGARRCFAMHIQTPDRRALPPVRGHTGMRRTGAGRFCQCMATQCRVATVAGLGGAAQRFADGGGCTRAAHGHLCSPRSAAGLATGRCGLASLLGLAFVDGRLNAVEAPKAKGISSDRLNLRPLNHMSNTTAIPRWWPSYRSDVKAYALWRRQITKSYYR